MVYAMSHIDILPRWFGAVHPRYQTPSNAILFYAGFALLLALSGGFVFLAAMSTVVRLMVYVMCIATLPVLKKKKPETEDQFRLPGGMVIPVVALLLSLWLMTHASAKSWLITGIFMLVGSGLYYVSRRYRADSA
jgi:amino acid transporter